MRTSARAGTKSVLTETPRARAWKRIERERESLSEVPDRAHIASTEKIAQEKFFFQGGREKIGFFREIKMVYGSIARPERSKLGS